MTKTPNYDAKVKAILDNSRPGERTCALLGTKWYMDENEIAQYRKYNVPPSKYAPLTRMKLINTYFVLFDFWYNTHAETGAQIISTTHPASGVKVIPDKEWFSRDFTEYAKEPDLHRSVLDQLFDLTRAVPQASNYNYVLPENSVSFISLGDQDSYFVLASRSKRCCFTLSALDCETSAEVCLSKNVQKSYRIARCARVHGCRYLFECDGCISSDFLFDCRNCEYCFMSSNKRNKKFLWCNVQFSKEEWKQHYARVDLYSWSQRVRYEHEYRQMIGRAVWPENFNKMALESTGEYITNANNIENGFYVFDGTHDMQHVSYGYARSNDCYITVAPGGTSDSYYSLGMNQCSWNKFSLSIMSRCYDVEYCSACQDLEHCFGCVGLKKKKFCIFNKQYSEFDYWKTLDAIKCKMLDDGEYGEYPPAYFSFQFVSGSGAPVVFGATEEEMQKMGARFFEPDAHGAEGPTVDTNSLLYPEDLPDTADDFELLGKPFFDRVYGRRFGYVKPELALYHELRVAPPRAHPTRRMNELYAHMNMAVFTDAGCASCGKTIRVGQNRMFSLRKIYCKECYLKYLEKNG